jgi:ElaB protein
MADMFNGGKLAEELRALVSEAEALLRSSTETVSAAGREQTEATMADLRKRLTSLERQVKARARDVDDYVHDNPWSAVAMAGGVALLLGLIMGRRG